MSPLGGRSSQIVSSDPAPRNAPVHSSSASACSVASWLLQGEAQALSLGVGLSAHNDSPNLAPLIGRCATVQQHTCRVQKTALLPFPVSPSQ